MKIRLVLEGGGMRGLYTAGVLDVMMEQQFMPDVVCGTSAGDTGVEPTVAAAWTCVALQQTLCW
ncbi:MAG: patatin-like phospholipase family protein [Paludibacteraceae bacterium]|nr:patatin-like phospholipase family protein [Paludibacteraceae bacterium]